MVTVGSIKIAITAVVFILMVVVGTDCTWPGLRESLKRPGLAALVVLGQFLLVPAVMYGCCQLCGVPTVVTLSLMLIACCPTGAISNSFCYLARGNTSLSVALTTLSLLVSVALTPAALLAVGAVIGTEGGGLPLIPVGPLVQALVLTMIVPLLIGGALRASKPEWISARQGALRRVALVLIVALLALIIASGPAEVARHLREILFVTPVFTLILVISGWLAARSFRLPRPDRSAVLFELPCRNLAIAAVVGISVFSRPDLVFFSAALFVIQSVMLLVLTSVARGRGGDSDE